MKEVLLIDGGKPVKNWCDDLEDSARQQMENVSRLPFIYKHAALMPDAHAGYGMPIGGVFGALDALVPYAIGVDIGCGVSLLSISLSKNEVTDRDVRALMDRVRQDVPVGNGPGGERESFNSLPAAFDNAQEARIGDAYRYAEKQVGTLGGGNHFLELQEAVGGPYEGRLFFMIHSGSRSLGKKTCDYHVKIAQARNEAWHSVLPHKEVAYLPWKSQEGQDYWADMQFCLQWAERNRLKMSKVVAAVIADVWGLDVEDTDLMYDCHHNFAAMEQHFGKNLIVHRKGAVRARRDEVVLIPGSMSTGSFIARGLGNVESLQTCQHGAGRARSRAATRAMVDASALSQIMDEAGVYLSTPGDVRDEAAPAYKDIFAVMEASADLVEPIQQLKPLGVVKG